ncbi:KH domain-containing protein HEN4-like isoform X3 [Camellia sinensis]|uniref:KH domain-containing protein HEN4-like isoform X3 n=1 Tax=Camellia sinensis TaxID=4442 RepID=UPI00103571AD|nr:KH domain-containing protein HEN4-like isoform X3 [Camellia sinensis]
MDASFVPDRPFDHSAVVDMPEPPTPTTTKRRHHHPPSSGPPSSITFRPPPPPLKLSTGETLFRILCPATKTGGVIGKGGAVIRQVRENTGARIRIDDSVPGCEERVILIAAESTKKRTDNVDAIGDELANLNSNSNSEDEGSPAQQALLRVFERILKVDEERSGVSSAENEKGEDEEGGGNVVPVVCRLLAPSNQVGCVLGRGGKIVERIRHDSGAKVRVLTKDQIPACASPGDELIQITGNFPAVKKALLSVSSCLQDNPRAEAVNSTTPGSSGMALHGTGTENIGANHRMVMEEEVVFKLLCQVDKVGSLIGKGGSIIRALQNETGATIKIADAASDSDERVVVIFAREASRVGSLTHPSFQIQAYSVPLFYVGFGSNWSNSEQRHSPAQDAVIRVHCRIAEIGFEPGAAVVARILVHSQQIGCLLGKGGIIIAELRRATGASIRVFPKEQIPKFSSRNEEVVQIIGSLQSVQDALFQITSRLRETIFPFRPHPPNASGSSYLPSYPDMMPPPFRPRHDPASPGPYPSPVGLPRGVDRDRVAIPSQHHDPQPFSHSRDHVGPTYFDRAPYHYGSERPGHGPLFDRQSPPRGWIPQVGAGAGAGASGYPRGVADVGGGFPLSNGPTGSGSQGPPNAASTTVEVVIPQALLSHVYGENNSNLSQIRQISGAKVVVHDPRPGATEGVVVVSGTTDQLHAAQSLIHAFILAELPF